MRISLQYKHNLELTVCLSLITAQPVEINDIEISEEGLTSSQISLLELFDKICNGVTFDINETGCRLRVIPGTLIGGEIEHECDNSAALGYYAMYLLLLSPFCKKPIEANLYGVTNKSNSISPEFLYYAIGHFIKDLVGIDSSFEIVVKKRGAFPNGGGHAIFKSKPTQSLKPMEKIKIGKIQKVRGTAWSTRLNPTLGKRQIDGIKKLMNKFLSDVYLIHDHKKGEDSGNSPGYGIIVTATTTEGISYVSEVVSVSQGSVASIPEDLGEEAGNLLNQQMIRGGVIVEEFEPLLLTMLAVGKKNVSKIVLGVPSTETAQALLDIKLFTGVKYSIEPLQQGQEGYRDNCNQQLLFTCIGAGLVNLNRSIR